MSKFKDSFLKGQEIARKAEQMRQEIDDVFNKLNEELLEVTDGRLTIERAKRTYSSPYLIIKARNPKLGEKASREIAEWLQSYNGYPCLIRIGSSEDSCHDREALENGLALMLENDRISEVLKSLINTPVE